MTSIEWTDRTWNPVRGCSRVSEGCRNCYAERRAARFSAPGQPFYGFAGSTVHVDAYGEDSLRPHWTGRVELIEKKLREPLGWKNPSRVFVNSMSDLFHESLPDEAIDRVFDVMHKVEAHTFQVLTKRPERMLEFMCRPGLVVPRNVWLGVSAEDQSTADYRIPLLLQTPATVRFISAEPLLEPIDLVPDLSATPRPDWVIVGGESGPKARTCHVEWIRSIVEQCKDAGVPVFVRQLGSRPVGRVADVHRGALPIVSDSPVLQTNVSLTCRDSKGGDPSEWPEDLRIREFPA